MPPKDTKNDPLLTRYLLGALPPEQSRKIEGRSLRDESYMERIITTHNALVCEFECGGLTDEEREALENQFLHCSELARKLEIAQFLYRRVQQHVILESDNPVLECLLSESPSERLMELAERALRDEALKTQLDYAEYALILAYISRRLSTTERQRFEQYYLCAESPDHKERTGKLQFVEIFCASARRHGIGELSLGSRIRYVRQRLSELADFSIGPRKVSFPAWQPLTVLSVLVLGAIIFAWTSFSQQFAITRGLANLDEAYPWERATEGRLTALRSYAAYLAPHSGSVVRFRRDKRAKALSLIARHASEQESPVVCHALGILYLTAGDLNDLNEAIRYLEIALQKNPDDAKLHNDLAVALAEREKAKAKTPGQSTGEDGANALEHLHRAIALNPSLSEAYFNLGLVHQALSMWHAAEKDWKQYLEKDSESLWATEARYNLVKIAEKTKQVGANQENIQRDFLEAYQRRDREQAWLMYKQSRVGTRSAIINKLVDNYISMSLSGKSAEAAYNLSALRFIGDIEHAKVQDRFTYDLARFYQGASQQQLRQLSNARKLITAANDSLKQARVTEAINAYQQAIDIFDKVGDVAESLAARSRRGHCYFQQASAALALSVFTPGYKECQSRNYLWLQGMFLNGLVNINVDLTKYSVALDYSLKQLALAKQIQDDSGWLLGVNRLTDIYLLLARRRETLLMVQEGLALAGTISMDATRIMGLYVKASMFHLTSGRPMAALDYQKEALELSRQLNDPWVISRYQVFLGLVYHKLGNHAEASRWIRESAEIGERLQDEKMRREIMSFAALNEGDISREVGDFDNALKSYKDALWLYNENEMSREQVRLDAKKGCLLTYIKRGDHAAAEEELKQVLDLYEQQRQNIGYQNSRNDFFDNDPIYDIVIDYIYGKGQDRRALDYVEESRGRSLFDAVNLSSEVVLDERVLDIRLPRSIQPLKVDQIQSQLPAKTQLLQYAVLDKRLIIWVVSATDLKSYSVAISREELDNKVRGYLRLLSGDPDATQGGDYKVEASGLYNLLIKPVENQLDKNAEICIIPDKVLNWLSFASLISPATGKFLIEDYTLLVAPSANMFLATSNLARQKEGVRAETILSVGNPWLDRNAFPGLNLQDLPWATIQARAIAGLYPASTVLIEKYAREADVRRKLKDADVAHFATHYLPDEQSPMLSTLPLAQEENPASKESDGILQAFEMYQILYNLKNSRLRVVVLSACQTGIDRDYKGEGAVGLTRPFQMMGILVVASMWPVESQWTKELMVSFHRYRKIGGLSTAQALRRAQLDMIKSGSPELGHPYNWAAYTVNGGHAKF